MKSFTGEKYNKIFMNEKKQINSIKFNSFEPI